MSLERIHVYEVTAQVEGPGPDREYEARVAAVGGPLPLGTDVRLIVVERGEGEDGVLRQLVATHGRARSISSDDVSAPLDFGLISSGPQPRFWCAAERVDGRRLSDLLDEVGALPDVLSEAVAGSLAEQLMAVHSAGLAGIGVAPDRVFVREDGNVSLVDPGLGPVWVERQREIARAAAEAGEAIPASVPAEIVGDDPRVSVATDLYALGVLLFRCMAGEPYERRIRVASGGPESRRPSDVRPAASVFLSEVVHALLEPEESLRLASSAELVTILRERRSSAWWREHDVGHSVFQFNAQQSTSIRRDPDPPPIPSPAAPPEDDWFRARAGAPGAFATHVAPCIGRDAELALLETRARTLTSRGGLPILIEGPVGVGKTRLLDELMERCRAIPDVTVLFGEHRPLGIGRPLQAFSEALVRWIAPDRREVTEDEVRPLLGDATGVTANFAAFLSGQAVPSGMESLSLDAIGSAFLACLRTLTTRGPVVFVVENLQWADPEGLDLFAHLARASESLPLLMVGSHRPAARRSSLSALLASMSVLGRHRSMSLEPIAGDAARTVARALVRPEAAAGALLGALAPTLHGVPAAIAAAAMLCTVQGSLARLPDGSFEAPGEFAPPVLPGSLDALVDKWLDALTDAQRARLEMAVVQGLAFDSGVAATALGGGTDAAAFVELRDLGLLIGASPVWRFSSNILFHRLHDRMTDERLQECHELTAEAFLVCRNPDELPPSDIHGILSYRVAWHYLLAGRETRGLLYVRAALLHLRETWRLGDAERLADIACRGVARVAGRSAEAVELLRERADLLGLQGRRVEQREVLDDALLRSESLSDPLSRARIALDSADLRVVIGQLPRARAEAREALQVATTHSDDRLEARASAILGTAAFREGRFQEARSHLQRVLEISRRVADEEAEAEALQTLGTISQDVGSWEHAEELQRLAMGIYRRSGDLANEAEVLASLGAIAAVSEDVVKAEQYVRRALAIHRSLGDGHGEARALGQLGLLFQESLRLAEARTYHLAACHASRGVGARQDELAALVNLASTDLLLGRGVEARDRFGDALRAAREIGDVRVEAFALVGLADVARIEGEFEIAEGLLERASTALADLDDPASHASVHLAVARIYLLRGETSSADTHLESALTDARSVGLANVVGLALGLRGLAAARGGDVEQAEALFADAERRLVEGPPSRLVRAELLFLRSLAARVAGDADAADQLLLDAEVALLEVADTLPDDDRTIFLTGASPAREIVVGVAALHRARDPE